jgi:hypothetical protein
MHVRIAVCPLSVPLFFQKYQRSLCTLHYKPIWKSKTKSERGADWAGRRVLGESQEEGLRAVDTETMFSLHWDLPSWSGM